MRGKTLGFPMAVLIATVSCVDTGDGDGTTHSPEPAPPPLVQAPRWDQWGGSASRSRGTLDSGPLSAPGIVWSALVDERIAMEPILATAGGRRMVLVAGIRSLWAVDFETGQDIWTVELPGSVSSAPAVSGDRVWLGSLDGFGFTLDLASGGDLRMHEADFTLEAAALVIDGVFAFEETARSGRVPTSRLHAVDAASLEERWHVDFINGAGCAPASDGERIFVHAADGVTALNVSDGSLSWRHERERRRQPIGPVVADGRVIVQSVSRLPSGTLTALDAKTGDLLWDEVMRSRALAAPALTDDGLFLVLSTGKLQRRDPATGAVTWESPLAGRAETPPVVAASLVFVGGTGFVAAFDRESGEPAWTVDVDGEVLGMSVDGDSLLVAMPNGFVHRLVSGS